jgi:dynein heavy chain
MPTEDGIFKKYDIVFKEEMARLSENRNAIKGLLVDGFLTQLGTLQTSFEYIQKKLNLFLEQKRTGFARFYFLSNTDLLEMIGQSKEPKKIMIHIGKIFEGIDDLGYNNDNKGPRGKAVEIESIKAEDGEEITI